MPWCSKRCFRCPGHEKRPIGSLKVCPAYRQPKEYGDTGRVGWPSLPLLLVRTPRVSCRNSDKRGMWRVLFAAVMIFAGSQCARAAYWQADFGDAVRRAYGENRIVLMFFTSSDNCGSCTRLQEEVFSALEFQRFADRHLILVE